MVSNDDLYESYAFQTNLVGEFTTGALTTLLFGVDQIVKLGRGQRRLPGDPSLPQYFYQEADPISKPDSELTCFLQ